MAAIERRVRQVLKSTLGWDNHGAMPYRPWDTKFLPQLSRYRRAGFRIVGLNVGFDATAPMMAPRMLAHLRHWIREHPKQHRLVESPADLARRDDRLGVFFNIEGGVALDGQLSMVELYRDLGVRWMLLVYNKNNALGGGCMDEDTGLTRFGRQVVREMERVGITVCCSHAGFRTAMDVMRLATKPVIFSHSNPNAIWSHKRNIRDEAIRACAASGGVIGINGAGIFLGRNDISNPTVANHIDYLADLVGVDHIGLGLDYAFDQAEVDEYVRSHPELFPPEDGFADGIRMFPPEQISGLGAELLGRGYTVGDLRKIFGGNWLRVARATWPRIRA